MSQSTDLVLSDQPGLGFRTELNDILQALASSHKGGSSPSYAVTGMVWLDDTSSPWIVKQFDGTDWITKGKLDPTTNKYRSTNSGDAEDLSELPTIKQLQNSSGTYGVTTGSSGAYALDLGTGFRPTAYIAGQEFKVKLNHDNPGACSLNVMGSSGTALGAKSIKLPNGQDPESDQLLTDGQATFRYNGTYMVLMSHPAKIATSESGGSSLPVGTVIDYAGTTAPTGFEMCYGQELSRTTYADLFGVIGVTYGVGNGSTTFNLPDCRGRTIAGKDDMGGTSANRLTGLSGGVNGDTLGGTGGAESHTLTTSQMPSHSHQVRQYNNPSTENAPYTPYNQLGRTTGSLTDVNPATTSAGSSGAHNNVQPTLILNKIIKY